MALEHTRLNAGYSDNYVKLFQERFEDTGYSLCMYITLKRAGGMLLARETVNDNRLGFYENLGIPEDKVIGLKQVHSKRVYVLSADDEIPGLKDGGLEGDGIVTADKALYLTVTTADCLPIFLVDQKTGVFGIVHSGWKGTGIAVNAVERMHGEYGIRFKNIKAVIGPGIGSCCYSVDRERAALFRKNWGNRSVLKKNGNCCLDLKTVNAHLLLKKGVEDITIFDDCTSCNPLLGSYRREGKHAFTRMLALIGYFK
ncbi:MAG: peptidoglycan editing factor PgeF [Spirochaetota bacterium]